VCTLAHPCSFFTGVHRVRAPVEAHRPAAPNLTPSGQFCWQRGFGACHVITVRNKAADIPVGFTSQYFEIYSARSLEYVIIFDRAVKMSGDGFLFPRSTLLGRDCRFLHWNIDFSLLAWSKSGSHYWVVGSCRQRDRAEKVFSEDSSSRDFNVIGRRSSEIFYDQHSDKLSIIAAGDDVDPDIGNIHVGAQLPFGGLVDNSTAALAASADAFAASAEAFAASALSLISA
jgi:hypothetical protein